MKYLWSKGLLMATVLVGSQISFADTTTDRAIQESTLRSQREAVSSANKEYQDAVHRYGFNSPEVKTAESKLLDARQDLDRSLRSQSTPMPAFTPATPAPGVAPTNPGTGNPPPGAPATR